MAQHPEAVQETPHIARPQISLVIPVMNEEENVEPLVREIAEALDGKFAYEVVFVDDASTDATAAVIEALMADPKTPGAGRVRMIQHTKRAGKSGAVITAATWARGDLLVMMDGDRQNDPQDVPALVAAFEAAGGHGRVGVVDGQRRKRRDTVIKRLSSRTANAVRRGLLRDKTKDTGCGLKLLPREVLLSLPRFDGMHRFIPALVGRLNVEIVLQPVNDRPRVAGVSKYGFWNRLWVGIGDMLTVWWMIRRNRHPGTVTEIESKEERAALDREEVQGR